MRGEGVGMWRLPRILSARHLLGRDDVRWFRRWADGTPFVPHRPYLLADVWRPRRVWGCCGVVVRGSRRWRPRGRFGR